MNYWKLCLVSGSLMLGLGGLAACDKKADSATPADNSPPVATVNGTPIGRDFYEFYVKNVAGKPSSELPKEQREQALDNLIRAQLVAQQAEKDGVTKDKETAAILELSRLNVLQQAVSERYLKDKKPTEQDLRKEYETQVAMLANKEYRARHILVATETFANKLVEQLDKGGKFDEIAKRESMDSSKDQGGELGWFTPDRMVKPFADAVLTLKPGEYTKKPIQTQYGWHVIQLEETRDLAPPAFEGVKQQLERVVQGKKFKEYTDNLLKSAKVEKKI
jgi:peptidyl-prolyl cis-trans isomerase C